MLEAAYDIGPVKKGDLFYYAHMDRKSALPIGTQVRVGQQIGVVGDTGEVSEGTYGKFPPHLHLGWYDAGAASDRTNLESGAMNPYPLLLWLEKNGGAVTGGTGAAYCETPREPIPEPPAGENSSVPDLSGGGPDLDTGDANDARPSPMVKEGQHGHSPERQGDSDEKKGSGKLGGRIDTSIKDPSEVPADEPDKAENGRDGTSAPDGSIEGEERTSRPFTGNNSPGKIREKGRSLPSGPRPGWDSRSFYTSALTNVLHVETTKERGEKREQKPPNPPENKEPESPEAKNLPQPAAHKPEKTGKSSASCGAPGKVGEGRGVVRVTRNRVDGRQAPIGRDEWLALVKNDPEMRVCRAITSTGTGQMPHEVPAIWTGDPDHDEVRFDLRGGSVALENPDKPSIEKLRKIADTLGARVKGDDGEKH